MLIHFRNAAHDLKNIKIQLAEFPWDLSIRLVLSMGVPLFAGFWFHRLEVGVTAACCAMATFFNDFGGKPTSRFITMFLTTLGLGVGAAIGLAVGPKHWLPFIAVFLCGYLVGRVHGSSNAIENIARNTIVFLVGAATIKFRDPQLIGLTLLGGTWAILIMMADYGIRRHSPPDMGGEWADSIRKLKMGQVASIEFAISYGAMTAIALLLAEKFGARHASWVAMTTILVMRPDSSDSVKLILQRIVGTIAGVVLAAALVAPIHNPETLMALTVMIAFITPFCANWHGWIAVLFITVIFLALIDVVSISHTGTRTIIADRFYDTVLGCLLAMLGTALIPTKKKFDMKPLLE